MLTDRMSTTCLLVVIATKDPSRWAFFTFIIVLDLVAHWAQMYRYGGAWLDRTSPNASDTLAAAP